MRGATGKMRLIEVGRVLVVTVVVMLRLVLVRKVEVTDGSGIANMAGVHRDIEYKAWELQRADPGRHRVIWRRKERNSRT